MLAVGVAVFVAWKKGMLGGSTVTPTTPAIAPRPANDNTNAYLSAGTSLLTNVLDRFS